MGSGLIIKKLLQKFSEYDRITIFDIGACDFTDSIFFKKSFPNANVYAIEADKVNYERNYENAKIYEIKTFNIALSDVDGKTTFYPSLLDTNTQVEWRYAGSIVKPIFKENSNEASNYSVIYDDNGYEVETMRLDSFCEKEKIHKIDFIHIDVEGAEDKVLCAMGKLKPSLIFAETYHFRVKNYNNTINLEQFDELMFSLGYNISQRFEYDTLYEKF